MLLISSYNRGASYPVVSNDAKSLERKRRDRESLARGLIMLDNEGRGVWSDERIDKLPGRYLRRYAAG